MSVIAREQVARVIWTAMVDDEPPPDDDTIWCEGYLDAADAVIALFASHHQGGVARVEWAERIVQKLCAAVEEPVPDVALEYVRALHRNQRGQ